METGGNGKKGGWKELGKQVGIVIGGKKRGGNGGGGRKLICLETFSPKKNFLSQFFFFFPIQNFFPSVFKTHIAE